MSLKPAESATPEIPSIFTFLNEAFSGSPLIEFFHDWQTIIFSGFAGIFLAVVFHLGSRKKQLVPEGLQNALEYLVEILQNFILEVLGPDGKKYVPLLGTLFLYILCMNWLVLVPFMRAPTSNLNITVALAICVFVLVQYLNIKSQGFFGFLYHLAGSPKRALDWMLVPLLFSIELMTQFARPLTLAFRLFGNVVGEDTLISVFALFGASIFSNWSLPIGIPLQIPFMFLAILTGLMQALVFTLLSSIYILLSLKTHDGSVP